MYLGSDLPIKSSASAGTLDLSDSSCFILQAVFPQKAVTGLSVSAKNKGTKTAASNRSR